MTRYLWRVRTPDGDALTVIAADTEEAIRLAAEFGDDDGDWCRLPAGVLCGGGE